MGERQRETTADEGKGKRRKRFTFMVPSKGSKGGGHFLSFNYLNIPSVMPVKRF